VASPDKNKGLKKGGTMEITKKMLVDIRPEIEDALKEVSKKYGITMEVGSGHYGGLQGDFKLLLNATGDNGETKESQDFYRYASGYGLRPQWFGKTFEHKGFTYTIEKIFPRKRKMPIGVTRSDGSKRIMGESFVRRLMLAQGFDVPYYWGDSLVPNPVGVTTTNKDRYEATVVMLPPK